MCIVTNQYLCGLLPKTEKVHLEGVFEARKKYVSNFTKAKHLSKYLKFVKNW